MSTSSRTFVSGDRVRSDVGERIAAVRGSVSQAKFADVLGVTVKTVSRWESGDSIPDGPSLLALMEKFGADPAWLLTGAGAVPVLSARARSLLANYLASDEEAQRTIERVADLGAQSKSGRTGTR